MGAVSTEGKLTTDYKVVVDVKLATEEGGNDTYTANYQVKFLDKWIELDFLISLKQDVDEAYVELTDKAQGKWNVNIDDFQEKLKIAS